MDKQHNMLRQHVAECPLDGQLLIDKLLSREKKQTSPSGFTEKMTIKPHEKPHESNQAIPCKTMSSNDILVTSIYLNSANPLSFPTAHVIKLTAKPVENNEH